MEIAKLPHQRQKIKPQSKPANQLLTPLGNHKINPLARQEAEILFGRRETTKQQSNQAPD